jgi:hypothetical protein
LVSQMRQQADRAAQEGVQQVRQLSSETAALLEQQSAAVQALVANRPSGRAHRAGQRSAVAPSGNGSCRHVGAPIGHAPGPAEATARPPPPCGRRESSHWSQRFCGTHGDWGRQAAWRRQHVGKLSWQMATACAP